MPCIINSPGRYLHFIILSECPFLMHIKHKQESSMTTVKNTRIVPLNSISSIEGITSTSKMKTLQFTHSLVKMNAEKTAL